MSRSLPKRVNPAGKAIAIVQGNVCLSSAAERDFCSLNQ